MARFLVSCSLLALGMATSKINFREKMDLELNFEETTEYPKKWKTFNTAVTLDDRIVLAPKTKQEAGGQVFLKKVSFTHH